VISSADLARNYRSVLDRIGASAGRAGRVPADVTLVAVTKTFPADVVVAAIEAGATDLGENRAQELREKVTAVGGGARWHFIGHLQTNKVRYVVGNAALIHSVDRFGLAEGIARRAHNLGLVQDVLIEVNVSGEATKQGVEPARALALAEEIESLDGLTVRGLMTMAPFADDPASSRPYFADLAALGESLRRSLPAATELSMGMTRDFEVAVEEGATLVRVGEAIFGPRNTSG
jgi:pyridoxal phosphate enzyme (YggS family)